MSKNEIIVSSTDVALSSTPIHPDWILEGAPRARSGLIAKSRDRAATTLIWECTAGRFNWFYNVDETIHILDGGMTLTDASGTRRVVAGEVVFFPAGSQATWCVETYVRKIAFLHQPVPMPITFGLRAWHQLRSKVLVRAAKAVRRVLRPVPAPDYGPAPAPCLPGDVK
ncbi:MAG TPA: cupin domain-containing protein [Caulobacteraceae bacterium]|jgi:hypothetical protein